MRYTRPFRIAFLLFTASSFLFGADAPSTYTNNCQPCHGVDGHGKTNVSIKGEVPDLHSKKVQDLSDEQLYEGIARGSKHKAYPHAFLYRGLKEKDILELVKYIRTFGAAAK